MGRPPLLNGSLVLPSWRVAGSYGRALREWWLIERSVPSWTEDGDTAEHGGSHARPAALTKLRPTGIPSLSGIRAR